MQITLEDKKEIEDAVGSEAGYWITYERKIKHVWNYANEKNISPRQALQILCSEEQEKVNKDEGVI